jgi:hypothetical protein
VTNRICRHPLRFVPHAPAWLDCPLCAACFLHREDCPGLGTEGCAVDCMNVTDSAEWEVYRLEVWLSLPAPQSSP